MLAITIATKGMVERKELPPPEVLPEILEEMEYDKASKVQVASFITALYMLTRGSKR